MNIIGERSAPRWGDGKLRIAALARYVIYIYAVRSLGKYTEKTTIAMGKDRFEGLDGDDEDAYSAEFSELDEK